jgi:hypothetical protein
MPGDKTQPPNPASTSHAARVAVQRSAPDAPGTRAMRAAAASNESFAFSPIAYS